MIKTLHKYTSILIVSMLALSIISCKTSIARVEESSAKNFESTVAVQTQTKEESLISNEADMSASEDEAIAVDKGLFSVEIRLPASFFEGEDIDSIASDYEDKDIKITKNSDGSVTYKMSKSKHNEFMKEMKGNLIEQIEEIKNSEDYKSVRDITYNKTFSEIILVVEQEAFENSFDGFVALILGMTSLYYQLFNGANPEDYKVTIYFKNEETGEIFGDVVYPDAFAE